MNTLMNNQEFSIDYVVLANKIMCILFDYYNENNIDIKDSDKVYGLTLDEISHNLPFYDEDDICRVLQTHDSFIMDITTKKWGLVRTFQFDTIEERRIAVKKVLSNDRRKVILPQYLMESCNLRKDEFEKIIERCKIIVQIESKEKLAHEKKILLWNNIRFLGASKFANRVELAKNNLSINPFVLPENKFLLQYLLMKTNQIEEKISKLENKKIWKSNSVLFIYKGNIICHRNHHNIYQATAIIHNHQEKEIKLNVEFCSTCNKFLLEYSLFEHYREQYGALIGNFRMMKKNDFSGDYDLAEESPLRLSGYTVNQKTGFTEKERQYILSKIIVDNIMSKGQVIKYLSYFIKRNGAKKENDKALLKWKSDLTFVQNLNLDTQLSTEIDAIKKYR